MNPYLRIALMIVINLISFKLAGFWFGILATAIVIYRILNIIGILKSPSLYRGPFYEGVAFTKDYTGSYSQKEDAFKDAYNLINLFKLEDFVPIGIYFDSSGKVEESKLRCSIGIYKKNVGFPEKLPERGISLRGKLFLLELFVLVHAADQHGLTAVPRRLRLGKNLCHAFRGNALLNDLCRFVDSYATLLGHKGNQVVLRAYLARFICRL